MIIPDANLLLYAYDSDSPFHPAARTWLEGCLSGTEPVGFTHPTLFAFLRLSTNPRVYAKPMTLTEAAGHINSWLARAGARILQPPVDHLQQVVALLETAGGTGANLVTDAQIAATALFYRGIVHTADRDFLRFGEVRCQFPLEAASKHR
jgi:uncharacterized protein